jgi:hypothetical protein
MYVFGASPFHHIIIIIHSPLLDIDLASSSCQSACANRHSTWPDGVLRLLYHVNNNFHFQIDNTLYDKLWVIQYSLGQIFQLFMFCWHANEVYIEVTIKI